MTTSKPRSPREQTDDLTFDGALDLLRQDGGRITSSRRFLLRLLFETEGHYTAEELATAVQVRAPDIHISTIYRNLDELERLGIIVHSHLGHGPVGYVLASSAHSHFVCEKCGKMIEAPDELFAELAKAAESEFGFFVNPHHFAMLGRCVDCQ
jgi:Fur family ferric uptake transcriptional regulator